MRQQGRLSDWKDDRGFGFITPQAGGNPIFVHISAFERGQVRPILNAEVTYEVQIDPKKGPRAVNVAYVGGGKSVTRQPSRSSHHSAHREHATTQGSLRRTWRNTVLIGAVLLGLGGYAWQQLGGADGLGTQQAFEPESPANGLPAVQPHFVCEGKQHCSEMRSCEEAQFYVANCPNTKMDGDFDGRACEDECGH
jgi:cold shock CspA family protein